MAKKYTSIVDSLFKTITELEETVKDQQKIIEHMERKNWQSARQDVTQTSLTCFHVTCPSPFKSGTKNALCLFR